MHSWRTLLKLDFHVYVYVPLQSNLIIHKKVSGGQYFLDLLFGTMENHQTVMAS